MASNITIPMVLTIMVLNGFFDFQAFIVKFSQKSVVLYNLETILMDLFNFVHDKYNRHYDTKITTINNNKCTMR